MGAPNLARRHPLCNGGTSLQELARALNGQITGGQVLAPGPGHSPKDRSLSIKINASGEIVVHSYAGDDWRLCREHVRAKLGLPRHDDGQRERRSRSFQQHHDDGRGNHALAARLWREASDSRGTLVEIYLTLRRLELPDEAAFKAVRFHPNCPFGEERHPAMVCLVRDVTNEPMAIHRTALEPDGRAVKRNGKTFRMTLAPVKGGAIKIDLDENVTEGLVIGEGVETCLAARQMGLRPVWSAITAGGVAEFPVLPGIDGLHLLEENDEIGASQRAVEKCAEWWRRAGRTVIIVSPEEWAKDLNDELRGACQ
jgi:hypothetical protein